MVLGSVLMLTRLFVYGSTLLDYQLLLMRSFIPMFCPHLPKIALTTVINLAHGYEKKRQRLKIDYNLIAFSCWKLHNGALNFYMLAWKYEINLIVLLLRSLWSVIGVVWQQWDQNCLCNIFGVKCNGILEFYWPGRNLYILDIRTVYFDTLLTEPSRKWSPLPSPQ